MGDLEPVRMTLARFDEILCDQGKLLSRKGRDYVGNDIRPFIRKQSSPSLNGEVIDFDEDSTRSQINSLKGRLQRIAPSSSFEKSLAAVAADRHLAQPFVKSNSKPLPKLKKLRPPPSAQPAFGSSEAANNPQDEAHGSAVQASTKVAVDYCACLSPVVGMTRVRKKGPLTGASTAKKMAPSMSLSGRPPIQRLPAGQRVNNAALSGDLASVDEFGPTDISTNPFLADDNYEVQDSDLSPELQDDEFGFGGEGLSYGDQFSGFKDNLAGGDGAPNTGAEYSSFSGGADHGYPAGMEEPVASPAPVLSQRTGVPAKPRPMLPPPRARSRGRAPGGGPRFGHCSLHNKQRLASHLLKTTDGFYVCLADYQCKGSGGMSASDNLHVEPEYRSSKSRARPDYWGDNDESAICAFHGKRRMLNYLERDRQGQYVCRAGYECKGGASGAGRSAAGPLLGNDIGVRSAAGSSVGGNTASDSRGLFSTFVNPPPDEQLGPNQIVCNPAATPMMRDEVNTTRGQSRVRERSPRREGLLFGSNLKSMSRGRIVTSIQPEQSGNTRDRKGAGAKKAKIPCGASAVCAIHGKTRGVKFLELAGTDYICKEGYICKM
ncbi:unnamed protein product [Amoebophrya sp. A25]|nr:unnamed protein product [Amoebophrya sp. A25]|eukprot:GSA25T00002144001.1